MSIVLGERLLLYKDKGMGGIQEMKCRGAREVRGRTQHVQRPYHVPGMEADVREKEVKVAQPGPPDTQTQVTVVGAHGRL